LRQEKTDLVLIVSIGAPSVYRINNRTAQGKQEVINLMIRTLNDADS
jgi:alkylated DNA repair dioxygenase AlkB